jgi:hypothetical protein
MKAEPLQISALLHALTLESLMQPPSEKEASERYFTRLAFNCDEPVAAFLHALKVKALQNSVSPGNRMLAKECDMTEFFFEFPPATRVEELQNSVSPGDQVKLNTILTEDI